MASEESVEDDASGVSLEFATTRQIMAELRRRGDPFILALAVPGDEQPKQVDDSGHQFLMKATINYHGCKARVRLLAYMLVGELKKRGIFGERGN